MDLDSYPEKRRGAYPPDDPERLQDELTFMRERAPDAQDDRSVDDYDSPEAYHRDEWSALHSRMPDTQGYRELARVRVINDHVVETLTMDAAYCLYGLGSDKERTTWCGNRSRTLYRRYGGDGLRRYIVLPTGPSDYVELDGQEVPVASDPYVFAITSDGRVSNVNDYQNRYRGRGMDLEKGLMAAEILDEAIGSRAVEYFGGTTTGDWADVEYAEIWADNNFGAQEARWWADALRAYFGDEEEDSLPVHAARWRYHGFAPDEAAMWMQAALGNSGIAESARRHELSPEQLSEYWYAWDPDGGLSGGSDGPDCELFAELIKTNTPPETLEGAPEELYLGWLPLDDRALRVRLWGALKFSDAQADQDDAIRAIKWIADDPSRRVKWAMKNPAEYVIAWADVLEDARLQDGQAPHSYITILQRGGIDTPEDFVEYFDAREEGAPTTTLDLLAVFPPPRRGAWPAEGYDDDEYAIELADEPDLDLDDEDLSLVPERYEPTFIGPDEAAPDPEPERPMKELPIVPNGGVDNILAVAREATEEERDFWTGWYFRAARIAETIADRYDLPLATVAGVLAVLSPGSKWPHNVKVALQVLNWWDDRRQLGQNSIRELQGPVWDVPRVSQRKTKTETKTKTKPETKTKPDPYWDKVWRRYPKTFLQPEAPPEEGELRLIDDPKPRVAPKPKPPHPMGRDGPRPAGYPLNIDKALRILDGVPPENILDPRGSPKTRVFYESLVNPMETQNRMVLDGHAINIWRGQKIPLEKVKTPKGESAERKQMEADYAEAARLLGMSVQGLQALTWYIWKTTQIAQKQAARTEPTLADLLQAALPTQLLWPKKYKDQLEEWYAQIEALSAEIDAAYERGDIETAEDMLAERAHLEEDFEAWGTSIIEGDPLDERGEHGDPQNDVAHELARLYQEWFEGSRRPRSQTSRIRSRDDFLSLARHVVRNYGGTPPDDDAAIEEAARDAWQHSGINPETGGVYPGSVPPWARSEYLYGLDWDQEPEEWHDPDAPDLDPHRWDRTKQEVERFIEDARQRRGQQVTVGPAQQPPPAAQQPPPAAQQLDGMPSPWEEALRKLQEDIAQVSQKQEELLRRGQQRRVLYHVTPYSNLASIARHGLRPNPGPRGNFGGYGGVKGRLFLTEGEGAQYWLGKMQDLAEGWAEPEDHPQVVPVLLRIDATGIDTQPDDTANRESTSSYAHFTTETVEPERIQAWTGWEWGELEDVDPEALVLVTLEEEGEGEDDYESWYTSDWVEVPDEALTDDDDDRSAP